VNGLAFLEIDYADGVIAELGDIQPLAADINRQVIDAPANVPEGNFRLEFERARFGRRREAGDPEQKQQPNARDSRAGARRACTVGGTNQEPSEIPLHRQPHHFAP
jgi:hypothetical protein